MAYLLGYLAEKERFAVESIADGRKAIERIDRGDAVDLVLLDVMLPYTDGFELLERLRAQEAWKRVPVIILTSRTREHDAVRALGLGADDYLTKPFSPAELVARIRRRIGPRGADLDLDPQSDRTTGIKVNVPLGHCRHVPRAAGAGLRYGAGRDGGGEARGHRCP